MNFADVKEWRIPEGDVIRVIDSQNRVIWQKETVVPEYSEYMYLHNINDYSVLLYLRDKLYQSSTATEHPSIYYKIGDNTTWNLGLTLGRNNMSSYNTFMVSIPANTKVYLKSVCKSLHQYDSYSLEIRMIENNTSWGRKEFNVGGNFLSMFYGDDFRNYTMFPERHSGNTSGLQYGLFSNEKVVDASLFALPSNLNNRARCYQNMFIGCTSLTKAPSLPATTLTALCYDSMFSGCTSLTSAPALPATALAEWCYENMFRSCTSLTSAPALPATMLGVGCYYNMFYGCTSLTKAPSLSATILAESCYEEMFRGCTSLNEVACYATSGINENYSTTDWLSGVSSTGTFTKAAGTTWPTGTSGIPSGWTVVNV